jgi:phage-related baseplate assembly protein
MAEFADNNLAQLASDRLTEAGLMPPVNRLKLRGEHTDKYVSVGVATELDDALRNRITTALGSIPHKIHRFHEVSPGAGVVYGRRRD